MKTLSAVLTVLILVFLTTASSYAGLIHHYQFNNDASDSVIGGANGTLTNGASVIGGKLQLDGNDDYVQFDQTIIPTSGSFTVTMFAQQAWLQSGIYVELISQGGPFYLGHDPNRYIRVGDNNLNTYIPFPPDGNSHFFAVTFDGSSTKLYVDGTGYNLGGAIYGGADATRLGRQYGNNLEYFAGTIDEVRIYDNALSESEVKSLYNPVPIPSALLLFTPGLAGLAAIRRRFTK